VEIIIFFIIIKMSSQSISSHARAAPAVLLMQEHRGVNTIHGSGFSLGDLKGVAGSVLQSDLAKGLLAKGVSAGADFLGKKLAGNGLRLAGQGLGLAGSGRRKRGGRRKYQKKY